MNNKKTLILSIVGVLVLVMVVVGISYAMYTFTGTGSKENVITTGSISVNYAESSLINLGDIYPETDALGLAHVAHCSDVAITTEAECEAVETNTWYTPSMTFTITSAMSTAATIDYEVGLIKNAGSTLEDGEVKIWVQKTPHGGSASFIKGSATTGVLISTFAATAGELSGTEITNYYIGNGKFTADAQTDTFVIKAWVDENYDLPTTTTGEGTATHSGTTTEESYTFKVKVYAQQVF